MSTSWPQSVPDAEGVDYEVAVLEIEEAEYEQVLRRAKPAQLPRTWPEYCSWLEQYVEQRAARGWPLQRQRGTLVGLDAFYFWQKAEVNLKTLLAYAAHLSRTQTGNGGNAGPGV